MFKRIFFESFFLVFRNLDTVFRVCGAWFALQFVLLVLFALAIQGKSAEEIAGVGGLVGFLSLVLAALSSASIAVAWHRFALLGDQPALIHLKFGMIELRFLIKMLLIGLIGVSLLFPFVVLAALVGGTSEPSLSFALILLVGIILIICVLARFYIALPASAVERPLGLKEAFAMSKGLGWRMILAAIALSLPIALAGGAIDMIAALSVDGQPGIGMQIKSLILNLLLQVIMTVLGISVITSGYRIAMENKYPS